MQKLRRFVLAGALGMSFASCSPVCERAGNRIKNFTRDNDVMAEPATTVKQKAKEGAANESVLKDVTPQRLGKKPEYGSKPDFVFGNGDKLFIDKKTNMAKVVEPNDTLVVEGEYRKNFPDKQIVIVIDDQQRKYELGFRVDGFMLLLPKLDTERRTSK